jgi:NAD+ kinase
VTGVRIAAVLTHRRREITADALARLIAMAGERGVTLRFDPDETAKHRLGPGPGLELDQPPNHLPDAGVDVCFALGGDGTILNALRRYAGTGVPVFAINFGEMGFLATVDPDDADAGIVRAFAGDFEVMPLPAIELTGARGRWLAINDVSMHRQQGKRVADLEYAVGEDEVGRVRCDGLVIATPAGSTGYNLANGGPVMAWGVHGYVVSFIAPHSLTARTLVVAPDDRMSVHNRSHEEPVDVTVDGRPMCVLEPGERLEARFAGDQAALAQMPGTTFYQRLRQKFGRLATPL